MVQINFGGLTFGKMPVVKSVQYDSIIITHGTTSHTATINSVDTTNSMLMYLGTSAGESTTTDTEWDDIMLRLTLTNATTVTATRVHSDIAMIISFCIVEFYPGIVKSNQSGTITLGVSDTSATDTINSVDKTKSICVYLGNTTNNANDDTADTDITFSRLTLYDSTTVKATRIASGNINIVSYQVVEFY